jgi:hypothetical protein
VVGQSLALNTTLRQLNLDFKNLGGGWGGQAIEKVMAVNT